MQLVVYKCDECKKETTEASKHISLRFAQNSGIAVPPTIEQPRGYWTVSPGLNGRFTHFCDEKCLAKFFKKLLNTKPIK